MQTLSQIQEQFQRYLSDNQFQNPPVELYDPVNYILSIGGKRLRPALLLMSYNLFNEDIEHAMPAAFAVEVFHNFTLLHDDIMDEAPLRRGKPTVHTKYDVNTGILSGDVMLIYAYDYLHKVKDPAKIAELLSVFNRVAIEVCEGQQRDMNFEKRNDVTIEEYVKMIRQKTAVLLAGAMKMGAIIAGASTDDAKNIYDFGEKIGIAFQLQDDLLDTYGDPEKFGKQVGGDIIQNKKTYLMLKALEVANNEQKRAIYSLMDNKTIEDSDKVSQVKSIYNHLNIKALSSKKKNEFQTAAFQHLDAISVNEARKSILRNLAKDLLERNY